MDKTAGSERRKRNWDFSQYVFGSLQATIFFLNVMSKHIKRDHRLTHAFLRVLVNTSAMHKIP